MRLTSSQAFLAVLFVSAILASPAAAALVTVAVTGNVTLSDFTDIGLGTAVTGSYTYDDATPDSNPHEENGTYESVTLSLSFVDGSTISCNESWIWVNNNSSGHGTVDEYAVYFPSGDIIPDLPGPHTLTGTFEDMWLYDGRLYRNDPTGVAWDSDALPDPDSILSLLPADQSMLILMEETEMLPRQRTLRFELTDLSVVPVIPAVPAPGALLLGTIGLASAGCLRRRKAA